MLPHGLLMGDGLKYRIYELALIFLSSKALCEFLSIPRKTYGNVLFPTTIMLLSISSCTLSL